MALVVLICVGGVVCLTPLAFYLRWLAGLNRLRRPVIVPGTWDTVALLAGLSGFLLFGGGVLLVLFQSNARVVFRGNVERFRSAVTAEWWIWLIISAAYVLILVGGTGLVLLYRSRALAVYNIDRHRAESAVETALADLKIPAERRGDAWATGSTVVEMQAFDALRHVTFWLTVDDIRKRQEIERTIRIRLAETPASDGPAAAYLISAATTVGCSAFSFVVMIGYLVYSATS